MHVHVICCFCIKIYLCSINNSNPKNCNSYSISNINEYIYRKRERERKWKLTQEEYKGKIERERTFNPSVRLNKSTTYNNIGLYVVYDDTDKNILKIP